MPIAHRCARLVLSGVPWVALGLLVGLPDALRIPLDSEWQTPIRFAASAAPFAVWWVVDLYLRHRWNEPSFFEVQKQSRNLADIIGVSTVWATTLLFAIIDGVDGVWWFFSACFVVVTLLIARRAPRRRAA